MSIHTKLGLMSKMTEGIIKEEQDSVNDLGLIEAMRTIQETLAIAVAATTNRDVSRDRLEAIWLAEIKDVARTDTVKATNLYRNRFGVGLRDALTAVKTLQETV